MGIWNTITKLTYEFISTSTEQNFKNIKRIDCNCLGEFIMCL